MIPARPAAPPPRSKESISDKISRLRREEHAASRPRLDHAPPQAQTSAPRWLAAAAAASTSDHPPPSHRLRNSDPRRGTAGPAPPPSWTTPSSTSTDLSSSLSHDPRRRTTLRPRDLAERRKLAQPLVAAPTSSTAPRSPVDSLFTLAGRVLAFDLSRARSHPDASLLVEHVAYLPNHVRVRLVNDVFADSRNPAPLTDDGARELLRTDVSDGLDVEGECEGVEERMGRLGLGGAGEEEEDDERGGWEDDALAAQDADLVELVDVLDLSFAHVSLRTLRSLLLRPVGAAPPPPAPLAPSQPRPHPAAPAPAPSPAPPPKLVSAFPHLHTLVLTATPRLALADPLFDLLSHLVSLRHLSLAGKHLDAHPASSSLSSTPSSPGTATAASLLPRLAAATPTLRTLDLSWLGGLVVDAPQQGVVDAVRGVDWDARWGELRVLGVRGVVEERREGEGDRAIEEEERERVRREVREVVMLGRQRKKRRWIDVVV
ncbi:hypothetical protein JCM3775_004465 [Rhodotorula graminis]